MSKDERSEENEALRIAPQGDNWTALEEKLQNNLGRFTKTQKQIAAYILGHPREAAYHSMSQLAGLIEVSNAAMTRFLQAAGFESGEQLRNALVDHFHEKMGLASRLDEKLENVAGTAGFFSSVAQSEIEYVQSCARNLPSRSIEAASRLLARSNQVFLWAQRPYWGLMDLLEYRLSRFKKSTVGICETGHYVLDRAQHLTENDTVVGFAFQRSPSDLERLFEIAQERGAARVLITDLALIPTQLTANVILSGQRGPSNVSSSYTVPVVLIHALLLATGKEMANAGIPVLQELDELRQRYEPEHGIIGGTQLELSDDNS